MPYEAQGAMLDIDFMVGYSDKPKRRHEIILMPSQYRGHLLITIEFHTNIRMATDALSFLHPSSAVLSPLPTEETQPPFYSLECDHASLRKEKHIALHCFDGLSTLIADLKVPIHDDLHLVVGVGVDEGSAWF